MKDVYAIIMCFYWPSTDAELRTVIEREFQQVCSAKHGRIISIKKVSMADNNKGLACRPKFTDSDNIRKDLI